MGKAKPTPLQASKQCEFYTSFRVLRAKYEAEFQSVKPADMQPTDSDRRVIAPDMEQTNN